MREVGEQALIGFECRGQRRRRINEPPRQSQHRQHQDRDADRLAWRARQFLHAGRLSAVSARVNCGDDEHHDGPVEKLGHTAPANGKYCAACSLAYADARCLQDAGARGGRASPRRRLRDTAAAAHAPEPQASARAAAPRAALSGRGQRLAAHRARVSRRDPRARGPQSHRGLTRSWRQHPRRGGSCALQL